MKHERAPVDHFAEQGWVLAEPLAPGQVAGLKGWVSEIARWPDGGGWLHHREMTDRGPALCRSENLIPSHPGLCALNPTYNALREGDLRAAYYRDKLPEFAAGHGDGERVQVSLIGDFEGRAVT
jgi:hypothetical protein